MKKMSEVFELPVMVDSDGDIDTGTEEWILLQNHKQARAIAHAINHVDALADALDDLMEWHVKNVHILHHPTYDRASKALAAYRGEA